MDTKKTHFFDNLSISTEIQQMFADYATQDTNSIVYNMSCAECNINMHLVNMSQKDCEFGRISSLSDIFKEWFLFNSVTKKDIKTFLETEDLTDVFTEKDFIDLIYGRAYLDDTLLQFILIKLPFPVRPYKLNRINYLATNTKRQIKSNKNIVDKISSLITHKHEQEKLYYKMYRLTHPEQYKKHNATKRAKNPEHYKQYDQQRYQQNREYTLQRVKNYYNDHKSERLQYRKQYHQEMKQKSESAKQICATHVFLTNLRKTNFQKYLELYTRQKNPLVDMLKTCPALQNMDINMCPFCNENCETNIYECCNQKVLSLQNALNELQIIATKLKQR